MAGRGTGEPGELLRQLPARSAALFAWCCDVGAAIVAREAENSMNVTAVRAHGPTMHSFPSLPYALTPPRPHIPTPSHPHALTPPRPHTPTPPRRWPWCCHPASCAHRLTSRHSGVCVKPWWMLVGE